jgi:hypothetical protein
VSRSLNSRGSGIFSDRVAVTRCLQSCGRRSWSIPCGPRENGPAGDAWRIEVKRPNPCGRAGPFLEGDRSGLGLKIRRLLRCPASTYSQVFRRFLAAICDNVVANLGALCEGGETCPLDRRYMDEDILAAGIRLNETIPLRRIEPLYYPHRHVDFSMLENQRWCQKFDKRKTCPR